MEILLVLIVAIIIGGAVFLISQMYKVRTQERRLLWLSNQRYTVLRIDVPKNNDKAPLAAEQMFASIHGVYAENALYQPEMSYEIVAKEKFIQFFVRLPIHIKDFVEGQIYAQYPSVEIHEVGDYAKDDLIAGKHYAICELEMTKPDVYPIKLFSDFEVDPISGITSVMSNLEADEELCLQLVVRPVGDEWQDKGTSLVEAIRSGKSGKGGKSIVSAIFKGLFKMVSMVFNQAVRPGAEESPAAETKKELSAPVEDALKQIEMKILKLGYQTKIRILAVSLDPTSANVRAQNLAAAYKQYNTTNLNGFKIGTVQTDNRTTLAEYFSRSFEDDGYIFNIGELASLFHFPHESVSTPNIVWSGAKKGEPPADLPLLENTPEKSLTVIGETTFRNAYYKFGIKTNNDDRRRHIYVIGKSGTGKSVFLENMAVDDVWKNRGVIIVDPHGEFADKILSCIPDNRINDVVVFDPADRAYPVAFNLLENVDDDFKGMVASGFVGIFKKIFGNSWGPRLEHILRNTVLALLDYPNSTMLDIPKMLTENRFRDKVIEYVNDPVIKDFWQLEFAQYDNKFRTEAVSPILNKVGQFLATATIRNIVGQPQSTINIRDIMDSEKIMVVNLSRGKIGEDNSALLGAMMITKIQLAAMSRADVTVDKRPDCYLYVDEFQNFATDSFAVILSEARKYHLNLTIANQYIAQLPEEVRDAVFGNAGTLISFRVGGADADFLVKEYEPVFETNDLVNLDRYNIYIKLLIDGISSPAFSARTLPPADRTTNNLDKIIEESRRKYSRDRAIVEQNIMERSTQDQMEMVAEAQAFKEGGLEALLVKKKPVTNAATQISNETPADRARLSTSSHATNVELPKSVEPAVDLAPVVPQNVALAAPVQSLQQANQQIVAEPYHELSAIDEVPKEKKPRYLRYQNIIGDKLYKEQTARGGVKWYIGEAIDEPNLQEVGIIIDEKAKRMIELAKRVGDESELSDKSDKQKGDHKGDGGARGSDTSKKDKSDGEHKQEPEVGDSPSLGEPEADPGRPEQDMADDQQDGNNRSDAGQQSQATEPDSGSDIGSNSQTGVIAEGEEVQL